LPIVKIDYRTTTMTKKTRMNIVARQRTVPKVLDETQQRLAIYQLSSHWCL